jgi:hypothetical protein
MAPGRGQDLPGIVDRLRVPAERPRATLECRRIGPPAATALLDALLRPDCREPEVLADVLGELGDSTRNELPRLTAMLPTRGEGQRTALLRTIANGVLGCRDDKAIDALCDQFPAWARAGWFYSETGEHPTFAWCEYVGLQRRLSLRRGGTEPDGLTRALDAIRNGREGLGIGFGRAPRAEVHNLSAFGQHATREELEAVAELALAQGVAARGVVDELARYLRHETPRAGIILEEPCAGYGENAPVDLPAVKLPTLWRRDDWRFAIARAIIAVSQDRADRVHAIRHLLYAPAMADRLDAIAAVRAWPQPWTGFAPDLAACLDASERLVVREALISFGLARELAPMDKLERLAAGSDEELALLARKLAGH